MILETKKMPGKNRNYQKCLRRCDNCGKQEWAMKHTVMVGRKKRKEDKDYCKKCSYLFRSLDHPTGKNSPSYKNGTSLNDNGYLRYTCGPNKGKYVHKILFGHHLGRTLTLNEKVHHIDFDKLNNDFDNLYLCRDISNHSKLHKQVEILIMSTLGKKVWFNRKSKIYVNHEVNSTFEALKKKKILEFYHNMTTIVCQSTNKKAYEKTYVSYRRYQLTHRLISE